MIERTKRVSELIRREISQIISKEIETGGVFITLTRVEPSSDLRYVDVYFVTIPDKEIQTAIKLLDKNISDIQRILNKRVRMRRVPKIRFYADTSEQEAVKLDKIIEKLDFDGDSPR